MKLKKSQIKEFIKHSIYEILSEDDVKDKTIKYKDDEGNEKEATVGGILKQGEDHPGYKDAKAMVDKDSGKEEPEAKKATISANPFGDDDKGDEDSPDEFDKGTEIGSSGNYSAGNPKPWTGVDQVGSDKIPSSKEDWRDMGFSDDLAASVKYSKRPKGVPSSEEALGKMGIDDISKLQKNMKSRLDTVNSDLKEPLANIEKLEKQSEDRKDDPEFEKELSFRKAEIDDLVKMKNMLDGLSNRAARVKKEKEAKAKPEEPKKKGGFFSKVFGKKESVHESVKPRRSTVKEIKTWMKTLEENRYRKIVQADARRVAWFVNNNLAEDNEQMPKSMRKKWSRDNYGR